MTPSTRSLKTEDVAERRRIVEQTKRLIAENSSTDVTLSDLAEQVFVSRTRLCTAFKEETGMTIGEYRNSLRVRRAKKLLLDDNLSIADVASSVGFKRHGSFSEAFRRTEGSPPAEWRRQQHENTP